MAGLGEYFNQVTVSGDWGFRKPDKRMFELALSELELLPSETIMVGNDIFRDIYGGNEIGMKTVFFRSNQGDWENKQGKPDYVIYNFNELPAAINFLSDCTAVS